MSNRGGWMRRLMVMVLAGVLAALMPQTARAQMMGMGGQMQIPVTSNDIDKLGELLILSDEQMGQVKDLYQSFSQEHAEASKKLQEMMQEISEEYQENKDPSVFQDMTKKFVEFQQNNEKNQETMYGDIKLLLNEKQLAEWPNFERRVRRQQMFRQYGGMNIVSASTVDLVAIIEDQKISSETASAVAPILDQYEGEMDRIVVAQKKLQEEQTKDSLEGMADFFGNMDKFEKMFAESRALMVQARDLNARTSRQIAALLGDDTRPKFEKTYNETALPQVYRDNYVVKAFGTAAGMEDLTAEQKTQVADLKAAYEREAAGLNEKWASAIRDWEVSMKMTDFWQPGSRPAELKDSQGARKDLDTRTYEKLGALLSEEQREKLPKKGSASRTPGVPAE